MNAKEKATDIEKCPSCGANLTFSPEKQLLKCDHCGTEVEIESAVSEQQNFEKLFTKADSSWAKDTHIFRCNNCGAKEILEKKTIATNCSFCGTTNVVVTEELAGLTPNAVVPYKLTREQASVKVIEWAKKKVFAPKAFKRSITPEEIRGTFNPAFTFDADTVSTYSGKLARYHYTTRTVNGRTVSTRHTTYFNINGSYNHNFKEVTVQACTTIPLMTINKLLPFETNKSLQYDKKFLHGYTAAQHSKDGDKCWIEACGQMENSIRAGILKKYTYNEVVRLNIKTKRSNISWKYVLLPLYIGHCNWKAKLYNFFVNGFSGKVTGKVPTSTLKVFFLVAGIVLAVAAAGVLYWYFG